MQQFNINWKTKTWKTTCKDWKTKEVQTPTEPNQQHLKTKRIEPRTAN